MGGWLVIGSCLGIGKGAAWGEGKLRYEEGRQECADLLSITIC